MGRVRTTEDTGTHQRVVEASQRSHPQRLSRRHHHEVTWEVRERTVQAALQGRLNLVGISAFSPSQLVCCGE